MDAPRRLVNEPERASLPASSRNNLSKTGLRAGTARRMRGMREQCLSFARAEEVASYLGLAPMVSQSG